MCGIAGAVRHILGSDPIETLNGMNNAMRHRGPDMGELYCDDFVGLCHRRLSIIDLSESGRQPMHSTDDRYVIVFNGEIYNYLELRKELETRGHKFRTLTDTEVLLQAYIEWGPASLEKLNGMFAYVIWDKSERKIFAARDRIGKKPLYYYYKNGLLAFASEIKSLLAIPAVTPGMDLTAFVDYFKYLFIPHPKSIYNEVFKLPPAHYFTYSDGNLQVREYWDIDFSSKSEHRNTVELEEELLDIIREAVKCRLMSDVPLGAFLSGGIDSSGVVALMNEASSKPVTTCTIGFEDKRYNEAEYAKAFATSLHTDHHEYYVRGEPTEIIRKLVWHFDEPFADSSMVPTYYVSKMARKNVTVALSGDGGDENFAGYEKYSIDRFENRLRDVIPRFMLSGFAAMTENIANQSIFRKIHSLSSSALLSPAEGFYVTNSFITDTQLNSLLTLDVKRLVCDYNPATHMTQYYNKSNGSDHLAKILYTDLKLLLPGDFLVKVDRMSMANSLEVRSPLLDYRLIEFAAKLPSNLKLHGNKKKYILKKAFSKVLPESVLKRKKHGFEAPINKWFRSEVKELAYSTFFNNTALSNFVEIQSIKKLWEQHQTGNLNHGTLLWSLLIFSLWLEENGGHY